MANQNVPVIDITNVFEIIATTKEQKLNGISVPAIDLLGEAGIGKSEGVIQAGLDCGLYKDNIHVKNLAEIGDPAEMLGYPQTTVKVIFKPVEIKGGVTIKSLDKVYARSRHGAFTFEIEGNNLSWSFVPNNLFDGECKVELYSEIDEEGVYKDLITVVNVFGSPLEQYINRELIPHIDSKLVERIDYSTTALTYSPPSWVIKIKEAYKRGEQSMLILDDYTRATPVILAAVMELINKGTYGSWELPKTCIIVSTSNPDNGSYDVTGQDGAGRSRKSQYEMKFSLKEWGAWCYANRSTVDERVIDWLLLNPELLSNESIAKGAKSEDLAIINARSATNAARNIIGIPSSKEALLISRVSSCIGTDRAASFKVFLNQKFDLPKMEDIFSKISHVEAFNKLQEGTKITSKSGDKIDSVAAEMVLTVRMLGYIKTLDKIDKTIIDRLEYLLTTVKDTKGVFKQENIIYLLTKFSLEGRLNKLTRKPSITKLITKTR